MPQPTDADETVLLKILRTRPVLWVGAGMSVAAGFPSSGQIIEALREQCLTDLPKSQDYTQIADAFVREEGPGALHDLLQGLFATAHPPTPWHRAVAQLARAGFFSAIVTTNYDTLLERALEEQRVAYLLQTLEQNQTNDAGFRLHKLHGGLGDWRHVILSGVAYAGFASKYPFLSSQLDQLLTQKPVLFAGCSMTDPRLLQWLQALKDPGLAKRWFAILTPAALETLDRSSWSGQPVKPLLDKIPFRAILLKDHPQIQTLFPALAKTLAPQTTTYSVPSQTGIFVGREQELATLDAGLQPNRLQIIYQLVGQGGIGKTTLAREAARRFGNRFEAVIELLAAHQSPQSFALLLAEKLNLRIDEPRDAREARAAITWLLQDRRVLLLLDNLTNVQQAADFLPEHSPASFLITTREKNLSPVLRQQRADLQVELVRLHLFTPAENRSLFAQVLHETYEPAQDPFYDQIGQTLGYLPVALRLALNWMVFPPCLSANELLAQLQTNRLATTAADPGQDPELRTLEAVFDLGDSLTEAQHRTLEHLAVCAEGPVPLSFLSRFQAETEERLRQDLEILVAKSWCTVQLEAEERAYELHVLVRALLQQRNPDPELRDRFLAQIHQVYRDKDFPFQLKDRWVGQVHEAIAKWAQQSDPRLGGLVYATFHEYCERRGQGGLFLRLADLVLAKFPQDQKLTAAALAHKALILKDWGKLDEAFALHKQQENIYEALGDRAGLSRCYGNQAVILSDWGKLDEALALHKQQENTCEALGDRAGLSRSYGSQALILIAWGKLEEALALLKQQESICEVLGDRAGLSTCYGNQAVILIDWGKLDEALALLKQQESICEALGDRAGLSRCYGNQALILMAWGKLDEALALHKQEERICEALGDRAGLSRCYGNQAVILSDWGKLDEALALHKQEESIFETLGDRAGLAICWWNQSWLFEKQGDLATALALRFRAVASRREMGIPVTAWEPGLKRLEAKTAAAKEPES